MEGASNSEQILEAARFNNTELVQEIIARIKEETPKESEELIAKAINESRDSLGNTALHIASFRGNYEVLDILLDQHGVEVDPQNRLDGDTPLHLAVRYSIEEPEHGAFIVEELIDAGCDPRLLNNHGLKPIDLAGKDCEKLVEVLQSAEYAILAEKEEEIHKDLIQEEEEAEGSASDSD